MPFEFPGMGPLYLSLQLALTTTAVLLLFGTGLSWWLARTGTRFKPMIEAMVAMPMVLPPTVLGFYLLILMSPDGAIGGFWLRVTGDTLTFSFLGLVIASVLYSLPFVVQPLQNAFEGVSVQSMEAAATLGASPSDAFFSVAVPQARRGFLTATVMGFAHTLGEFGVVLMVGGNIPGQTRVVSIAIYDHVESLQYAQAHTLAAILLAATFVALFALYFLNRRWRND